MKFLATAVLLVALTIAAMASPGRGGGGRSGSSACKTSFPGYAEPLETFRTTGEATQDLKCYMSCVMQEKGKMASNGSITMQPLPNGKTIPDSLKTATEPCFGMTPTADLCETAYQHNKCLWNNDSEKRFMRLFD